MDTLVNCEACGHGATLHAGDGCAARRCACGATRETIVAEALQIAKREIQEAYRANHAV